MMMTDPMAILRRLYEIGCPTYRCNDGSRTRDGCDMCVFCEANLSCNEPHADGCEWPEVERLVNGEARKELEKRE